MRTTIRSRMSAAIITAFAMLCGMLAHADSHTDTSAGNARKPKQADELKALSVEIAQLDVADQASIDAAAMWIKNFNSACCQASPSASKEPAGTRPPGSLSLQVERVTRRIHHW